MINETICIIWLFVGSGQWTRRKKKTLLYLFSLGQWTMTSSKCPNHRRRVWIGAFDRRRQCATVHVACMAYQSVGSANFHFEISGTVGLFFFILDICKARHNKQKKKKNEIMQWMWLASPKRANQKNTTPKKSVLRVVFDRAIANAYPQRLVIYI